MTDDRLELVFVPPLVALLLNRENAKGAPLTEAEVIAIRDKATVIALPPDQAQKMEESRGFPDINPKAAWPDWQRIRLELASDDAAPN